ncbi:ATP-binding protein [Mycobacterium montefiorense]|nr:adenylate/guanylate cyclase domain-containing protein [Mycobacterium montefiorense]
MNAPSACMACGTELRSSARFCDACGAPIAGVRTAAEYKQVTVIFADVVQSMNVAAAVGPERMREIMTELVDRSAAAVQRHGGTLDKFTGDGVMAIFGAPTALEDHALRACLAALGIQEEAKQLAAKVKVDDGVDLSLRVGLNSGQVIVGEIGSRTPAYTAVGEQVGIAHRMESIAPPGAVMISAATARLVENVLALDKAQQIQVKGATDPVQAHRLLGISAQHQRTADCPPTLVGRERELATLTAMLDRSMAGHGSVVGLVGPAGIGKTRLARELVQVARSLGVKRFPTFGESHTSDVPFGAVARLLRVANRLNGLDNRVARARIRAFMADADADDVLLLDDLLGIADPHVAPPKIDPEVRRRRLTALISSHLNPTQTAVVVIEDAHWIDGVSESMLVDFLAVTPRTHWLVIVTYRPEYRGPLRAVANAQTIALAPLNEAETITLTGDLLGPDPSVREVCETIAARAGGNPFFAHEMTRELCERGVLEGTRGCHVCVKEAADVRVPATLQATIGARIDRLGPLAKRALSAAAVIGSRFDADLLTRLGGEVSVDELVAAELVDQIRHAPCAEYAFRHPLIRTVAYESQLKSDRVRLHRQAAAAIEAKEPEDCDSNADLIAEHLTAAGDLRAAYSWHVRAARWATNHDLATAHRSRERAQNIADVLLTDTPHRRAVRIGASCQSVPDEGRSRPCRTHRR